MRKQLFIVLLLAAMCAVPLGCNKRWDGDTIAPARVNARQMKYSIDDIPHTALIGNHIALYNFMEEMVLLAQQGHRIVVYGRNTVSFSSKDAVSYNTRSRKSAIDWCVKMHEAGYTVELIFDEDAKTYHCKASR